MKFLKYSFLVMSALVVTVILAIYVLFQDVEYGGNIKGEGFDRIQKSPQFNGDHFINTPPNAETDIMKNIEEMMGDQIRVPPSAFPIATPEYGETPKQGLHAVWFGHATVIVEMDGYRIMSDPMLSDYAFPLHAVAPKRYNPPPLRASELPAIDVVVVSHDHYDHLDMKTVQVLASKGTHFFVGLGVGAHLRAWQVPETQIHELDWWDSVNHLGLKTHCTPARHYSGRKSMDNSTLWTSWVVESSWHKVFHSGDTGYSSYFEEIGKRFESIDLSMIKIGDYGGGEGWHDVHMHPENSTRAHKDLGAKVLLPIHWGAFDLSNHAWDEPIKRAVKAARKNDVNIATPILGQKFDVHETFKVEDWWSRVN